MPRPFEPAVERVEQDQERQQPEHEQEGVERVGQRRNSGESGHQRQERASAGAQGVRVDPHRRPRGRGGSSHIHGGVRQRAGRRRALLVTPKCPTVARRFVS